MMAQIGKLELSVDWSCGPGPPTVVTVVVVSRPEALDDELLMTVGFEAEADDMEAITKSA